MKFILWFSRLVPVIALTAFAWSSESIAEEVAKPVKRWGKPAASTEATADPVADSAGVAAVEEKPKKIKYRAGKQVDFDKQTIQGELRRPEISVVTGNDRTTDNGLLRLREDFIDRITAHAGEEVE